MSQLQAFSPCHPFHFPNLQKEFEGNPGMALFLLSWNTNTRSKNGHSTLNYYRCQIKKNAPTTTHHPRGWEGKENRWWAGHCTPTPCWIETGNWQVTGLLHFSFTLGYWSWTAKPTSLHFSYRIWKLKASSCSKCFPEGKKSYFKATTTPNYTFQNPVSQWFHLYYS